MAVNTVQMMAKEDLLELLGGEGELIVILLKAPAGERRAAAGDEALGAELAKEAGLVFSTVRVTDGPPPTLTCLLVGHTDRTQAVKVNWAQVAEQIRRGGPLSLRETHFVRKTFKLPSLTVVEHVMYGGMELKEAIDGPTAQLLWDEYRAIVIVCCMDATPGGERYVARIRGVKIVVAYSLLYVDAKMEFHRTLHRSAMRQVDYGDGLNNLYLPRFLLTAADGQVVVGRQDFYTMDQASGFAAVVPPAPPVRLNKNVLAFTPLEVVITLLNHATTPLETASDELTSLLLPPPPPSINNLAAIDLLAWAAVTDHNHWLATRSLETLRGLCEDEGAANTLVQAGTHERLVEWVRSGIQTYDDAVFALITRLAQFPVAKDALLNAGAAEATVVYWSKANEAQLGTKLLAPPRALLALLFNKQEFWERAILAGLPLCIASTIKTYYRSLPLTPTLRIFLLVLPHFSESFVDESLSLGRLLVTAEEELVYDKITEALLHASIAALREETQRRKTRRL